jgi:uncharacterized protein (TIGR02246 family)
MTVAEVNAVAQAFHDGVASQDAAGLARLYAEDGRFLPPNMGPCEGRSAIQAAMQQLLDMGARSLDVEPLDVREAGEMTIEYGRYTLGIEPEGADAVTDRRKVRRRPRGPGGRLDEDRARHLQLELAAPGLGSRRVPPGPALPRPALRPNYRKGRGLGGEEPGLRAPVAFRGAESGGRESAGRDGRGAASHALGPGC